MASARSCWAADRCRPPTADSGGLLAVGPTDETSQHGVLLERAPRGAGTRRVVAWPATLCLRCFPECVWPCRGRSWSRHQIGHRQAMTALPLQLPTAPMSAAISSDIKMLKFDMRLNTKQREPQCFDMQCHQRLAETQPRLFLDAGWKILKWSQSGNRVRMTLVN
jgi:hypothetical protein